MGDTTDSKPRIYVACLASYNNGILHGRWIDADQTEAEIRDAIEAMLKASPIADAEEYAIHDYEGFCGLRVEEYTCVEQVKRMVEFVAEHGRLGTELAALHGGDIDEARKALEDFHLGCFESVADYMESMTEDSVTIPEPLRYYIDWKAMARDALLNGDIYAIETAHGEVHIFHSA